MSPKIKDQEKKTKKKREAKPIADLDLLSLFIQGKGEGNTSFALKIVRGHRGELNLLYTRDEQRTLLCTRGYVESLGTKRNIFIVNPSTGTVELLRAIFSGVNPNNIVWIRGFVPLNIDKALSIYSEAKSPLFQLNDEASN